mgnify:CR=1 FL=1
MIQVFYYYYLFIFLQLKEYNQQGRKKLYVKIKTWFGCLYKMKSIEKKEGTEQDQETEKMDLLSIYIYFFSILIC